jgi:hypothetical protein
MEYPAVICFSMLNELKTRAIHTELESVDAPEAFTLPTVKKWRRYFHQKRTDLFDDPMSGRPLTNDVTDTIGSVLQERPFSSCEVLCRHFRIGRLTCLQILHSFLFCWMEQKCDARSQTPWSSPCSSVHIGFVASFGFKHTYLNAHEWIERLEQVIAMNVTCYFQLWLFFRGVFWREPENSSESPILAV